MFYALPALGSCGQSHSSNVENLQRSIQRKWTKLDRAGIVLDIFIVAGLAIVAALALCAHYNLPLGPFSNISAIELPYTALLGGTAIVLLLADLVKMVNRCRGSIKNTTSDLGAPSSTTTVIPTNQDSTVSSTTTVINANQDGAPLSTTQIGEPLNTQDGSGWVDLPHFTIEDNSSSHISNAQFNLSTASKIEQETELSPQQIQIYTPIHIASLPKVQEVSPDDFVELKPTENAIQPPGTNNGGLFAVITNAVASVFNTTLSTAQAIKEKATQTFTDWVKSFFPPGTIQMRFYTIQINFILDQLLTYNESNQKFEEIGLPIPFEAKLKLLEEKKFKKELQINAFKEKLIAIIKANLGHPFSTRYALLDEIEIAYKALQDQSTHFQSFLQGLCYQLYTQFDGLTYGEDIVWRFLPLERITFKGLCETLKKDQANILGLRQEHPELIGNQLRDDRNRIQGAAGVAFSPMMTSNFACRLWKENSVQIIRYGTPTSQAIHYGAILGQMKLFIKECEERNESLLSFQHQDKNSNENERLKPMFELAEKHPTAFYCLGLDMDSEFYQQAREGIDFKWDAETKSHIYATITYEAFKKDLIDHIDSKECPKSQNLQERINEDERYQDQLSALADAVWLNYFKKDDKLSVEERKDFIFLYYIYYRKYMHQLIQPTFSSHQCKDTMDRSMSLATAAFLVNAVEGNQQNDHLILLKFRALVNFVGMIVKGSPMDRKRFERFISVIQRITTSEIQCYPHTCFQSTDLFSFGHMYSALPCDATSEASYKNAKFLGSTNNQWEPMATLTHPDDAPLFLEQIYRNNQLNYGIKIIDDTFQVYLKTEENVICKGQFQVYNDGNLFVFRESCTGDQKID